MAFSSHAFTPAPAPSPAVVALPADPILAALARHRLAWNEAVATPAETRAAMANTQHLALAIVLVTPCTTRAGAEALLRHLRACLDANGTTLALGQQTVELVIARAADLALFLGLPGAHAPISLGEAVAAVIRRLNRASEAFAALTIVAGGAVLTGLASLL